MAQVVLDIQLDIANNINRLKRETARMQNALIKYKEKYKRKTNKFYQLFDNGELSDSKDYMLWGGIYELQIDSKQKLAELLQPHF